MPRTALACLVALFVTCATPPSAGAQSGPASCATTGKNLYVRDVMTDLYLWYAQMPNVDPTTFTSPEAYLEAVRYRTLDSTFSYITSRAANDAFYSDSQFIGFGLSTMLTDVEMRVTQVFPGEPRVRGRPVARRSHRRDRRTPGDGADCDWRDRRRLWRVGDRRRVGHRRSSTRRARAVPRTWSNGWSRFRRCR